MSIDKMNKAAQYFDVKLEDGIELDGVFLKSIQVRKPKVKDMLLAEAGSKNKSEAQVNMQFLCNLTDYTPDQLGELSVADYMILNNALAPFLGTESQKQKS